MKEPVRRMERNRTRHLLLIENDGTDAWLIKQALGAEGDCHVDLATDGQEAMEYLSAGWNNRKRGERFLPEIILLDLQMPRVNGFEFLKWLRKESPADFRLLPVIVMSSSDEEKDINQAYALGANSYIVKATNVKTFTEDLKALKDFWLAHARTPVLAADAKPATLT
jgi:CheY-like chemotaxis protein